MPEAAAGQAVPGRLEGRAALVTGGGTGIGAAVARRLVAEGAAVVVRGRRQQPLEELAASLPDGRCRAVPGDVTSGDDVARAVEAAVELGSGALHAVVNNAGIGGPGSVADVSLERWRRVLEVDLTGPLLVMRAALPHLRAARGAIVNVSSVAGLRAVPESAAYCTAKAGLVMLSKQAALDLGPEVRVNCVCPGWVRTPMADGEMDELGPEREAAYAAVTATTPLRRPAAPEELAGAVAYLVSDDSSFVTGAVLTVDGGSTVVDAAAIPFLEGAG